MAKLKVSRSGRKALAAGPSKRKAMQAGNAANAAANTVTLAMETVISNDGEILTYDNRRTLCRADMNMTKEEFTTAEFFRVGSTSAANGIKCHTGQWEPAYAACTHIFPAVKVGDVHQTLVQDPIFSFRPVDSVDMGVALCEACAKASKPRKDVHIYCGSCMVKHGVLATLTTVESRTLEKRTCNDCHKLFWLLPDPEKAAAELFANFGETITPEEGAARGLVCDDCYQKQLKSRVHVPYMNFMTA